MTKLLEDVRSSDRTPQDGDGAACWTKLLDDSNSTHKPIIIGPAVVTSDANTGKDLLVTVDPETGKTQQTVDSTGRDPVTGRRRESILGTFHRQLRMSLKAVSDTTGPLTSVLHHYTPGITRGNPCALF
ncbi:hypothetical protein AND_008721 [Anopheles darlingi]|uniref:Uncharacterized protein n=1 Tax=Anopheles darlingi TaxID=43151 RepID=W5JA35_ANODA|nr:hypothetical protein AND_008721 [Anopheles darlingi]